jgi:pantothenate synthetase
MRAGEAAYNSGITSRSKIVTEMDKVLAGSGFTAQYWSIADPVNLQEVETIDQANGAILSSALIVGKTRIIDNILLGMGANKL